MQFRILESQRHFEIWETEYCCIDKRLGLEKLWEMTICDNDL